MAEKLSELFEQAHAPAPAVTWNGQLVHSMYELPDLADGTEVRIMFDDPNPSRPEGMRLKVRGGKLLIEERELDDIVLWSDSSPRVVTATVKAAKGCTVRLWNCWRDPAETMQAWIGNAGMLVETTSAGLVLKCSDGFGDVTFDDLVATSVFAGFRFPREVISIAVRWYLRYGLSCRDVEELLSERGSDR